MFKDGRSILPCQFSKRARLSRALIAATALATAALAAPGAASADAGPKWTCRGSALSVSTPIPIPGLDHVEPVVANGLSNPDDPGASCGNTDAGLPNIALPGGDAGLNAHALFASTRVNNPDATPDAQAVSASAGVTNADLQSPDGSFKLHVGVARSFAAGACSGGQPQFAGGSEVANISINGQSIPADEGLQQVGDGITDGSNGQITLKFNEEVKSGDSLIRRAVHVKLGSGSQAIEVILGESRVASVGDVCAAQGPTPPGSCPSGTTFDPQSGFCISTVEVPVGSDGKCPLGTVSQDGKCFVVFPIVGAGETPIGGTLVPIGQLKGGDKRCKKPGFGRDFAIVGTDGPDRITGTNRADRIFSFGGKDRVSGGRGGDCIDGGTGKDQLDGGANSDLEIGGSGDDTMAGGTKNDREYGGSGSDVINGDSGKDRLYGESGRDKLSGGTGNDALFGGKDRDYLAPGQGRDTASGGSGNDAINVAVAGVASKVDCGAGRDTVRFNRNERKRIKHCERMYVIR